MAAATDTPATHRARTVGSVLVAGVWFVALAYAGLVLLRFVSYDTDRYLAALNAQTVWLFLPAYAIASAAWCFRRYALAVVATVVVAFQIVTVVPSIGRAEAIPTAARRAPHLRLVTANLRYTNPNPERLAAELLAADADVLVLQELTGHWVDVLNAAGFARRYPYALLEPRENALGEAIYSRLPLDHPLVVEPAYNPMLAADVAVGGRRVSVVNVHAIGPTQGMTLHRQSVAIARELARTRARPRVVGGDFNATPYNKTMHDMEDLGLESAHRLRGRGLAVTWPNGKHLVPPMQLDHVLVDDALVVLDIRELRGSGSDHKPVLVDFAVMSSG